MHFSGIKKCGCNNKFVSKKIIFFNDKLVKDIFIRKSLIL